MRVFLFLLLLVPQLAAAKVYMCVDEATGKKIFTDKGCQTTASREEVRVPATNTDSGSRSHTAASTRQKAWVSDRDIRKTGRDYNIERRSVAVISSTPDTASGGI